MPELEGILTAQGQAFVPGVSCCLPLFPAPGQGTPALYQGKG